MQVREGGSGAAGGGSRCSPGRRCRVGTGRGCVRRPRGRSGRGEGRGRGESGRLQLPLPGPPEGEQPFPLGLLPARPSAAAAGPRRARRGERAAGAALGASPPRREAAQGGGDTRVTPSRPACPEQKGRLPAGVTSTGVCCAAGEAGPASPVSRPSQGRGRRRGPRQNKERVLWFAEPVPGLIPGRGGEAPLVGSLRRSSPRRSSGRSLICWQPPGLKTIVFESWKPCLIRSSVLLQIYHEASAVAVRKVFPCVFKNALFCQR